MKTKASPTTNSMSRPLLRRGLLFIPLVLGCFGLLPKAQAVVPAPGGGYPGNNTAQGQDALFSLSTGLDNTANGFQALFNNTLGSANTATGSSALHSNTTGNDNTATGRLTLFNNTTGGLNTATGDSTLFFNTTGNGNTATGGLALSLNTTGNGNTATGGSALESNTTGNYNAATGGLALGSNSTGSNNTATGCAALFWNASGSSNTATGIGALYGCAGGECGYSTGNNNTAIGAFALLGNVTGNGNTAIGVNALYFNTTGSNNIGVGLNAGQNLTTGSNNIDIGNVGVAAEANTIRIGTVGTQTAIYIAGIIGKTISRGTPVFTNGDGQLGTIQSSARFKEQIKPIGNASEAILALKPVMFRYKKEIDAERTPQFGLVAEDVEKINPDLVVRDAEGNVYTVRYEAVNAMLLNEFLKEHRKNEEQGTIISELKSTMAQQQKQIEALTAGLQKVSAHLELSKSAPQTVLNDQ